MKHLLPMVVTCVCSLGGLEITNVIFPTGADMLEVVSISLSDADVNTLCWLHYEATESACATSITMCKAQPKALKPELLSFGAGLVGLRAWLTIFEA